MTAHVGARPSSASWLVMEKQNSPPHQRSAEAGHVPRRHFRLQGMRRHGGCVLNVVAFFFIRVLLLPGCASLTPDFAPRSDRRICQDFQRLQMAPSSVHLSSARTHMHTTTTCTHSTPRQSCSPRGARLGSALVGALHATKTARSQRDRLLRLPCRDRRFLDRGCRYADGGI